MPNQRENALSALFGLVQNTLSTAVPTAVVDRNGIENGPIPGGGLVVVRDGKPGKPQAFLGSPPLYGYDHRAEIVLKVQDASGSARDGALSALLGAINAALMADPSLGGTVELATPKEPKITLQPPLDPAISMVATRVAVWPIVLSYVSDKRI